MRTYWCVFIHICFSWVFRQMSLRSPRRSIQGRKPYQKNNGSMVGLVLMHILDGYPNLVACAVPLCGVE